MKLKRLRLLADLNVVAPAIADRGKIPGLECIWFSGTHVSAYNDLIGIEHQLETDFTGGVPGKILIGYLEKINAEEVDFTAKQGKEDPETGEVYVDLHVSAGQSRLTLSLQPLSKQLWTRSEPTEAIKLALTKDFMTLLQYCMISFSKDRGRPEQSGVTFEAVKDDLNIYTTDAATMCWVQIPQSKGFQCPSVIITGEFCDQLLKLCRAEDTIYLSPTAAIALNRANTFMFGKIVEVVEPLNFTGILKSELPSNEDLIPITTELVSIIDRADFLASGSNDTIELTLTNNELKLSLKSEYKHELVETIEVESAQTANTHFDPSLIKRALPERTYFSISKSSMVLTGPDNFVHIISARVV